MRKKVDITGMKFGLLTAIYPTDDSNNWWLCKCECGRTKIANIYSLLRNQTKTCGHTIHRCKNLIGKTFGRLTVLELYDTVKHGRGTTARWKCICSCENHTIVYVRTDALTTGDIVSCGCYGREKRAARFYKHGLSNTRIYKEYKHITDRVILGNPDTNKWYKDKGIGIAKIWYDPSRIPKGETVDVEGLNNFIEWAYNNGYYDQPKGTPYNELLSIERLNPNDDYSPDNCIWIPMKDQANNKNNNKYIYDDEILTYAQFERKYNLQPGSVSSKINRGWDISEVIFAAQNQHLEMRKVKGIGFVDKNGFHHLVFKIDQTPVIEFLNKRNKRVIKNEKEG